MADQIKGPHAYWLLPPSHLKELLSVDRIAGSLVSKSHFSFFSQISNPIITVQQIPLVCSFYFPRKDLDGHALRLPLITYISCFLVPQLMSGQPFVCLYLNGGQRQQQR